MFWLPTLHFNSALKSISPHPRSQAGASMSLSEALESKPSDLEVFDI